MQKPLEILTSASLAYGIVIIIKNSIERKYTHPEFLNAQTCTTEKKSEKDNYRHKERLNRIKKRVK